MGLGQTDQTVGRMTKECGSTSISGKQGPPPRAKPPYPLGTAACSICHCTTNSAIILMVWCIIMQRENFTSPLC